MKVAKTRPVLELKTFHQPDVAFGPNQLTERGFTLYISESEAADALASGWPVRDRYLKVHLRSSHNIPMDDFANSSGMIVGGYSWELKGKKGVKAYFVRFLGGQSDD